MSSEALVLTIKYPGYCHIVLNRPHRLNAINFVFTGVLLDHIKAAEEEDDIKFIILKGAGRAFCAGGDIKDLVQATVNCSDDKSLADFCTNINRYYKLMYFMGTMKTPVIALMNGITYGGGIGFAEVCPFKVATEKTVFALPEASIGHFCDAGNSFTMSRLEDHLGVYLQLTGHQFKAEDALFAGLATHFMDSAKLEALENSLAELNIISIDAIDKVIRHFSVEQNHMPPHYTLFGEKLEIIKRCFQFDTVEEIVTALNIEKSQFTTNCLQSISKLSPTSLKVSLEMIRQAKNMSLAECLKMEYRVWCTLPFTCDYKEGVSCHLTKETPHWNPSRLEDINVYHHIRPNYLFAKPKKDLDYNLKTDFITSPHHRFHLPTSDEIIAAQSKHNLKSDTEIIRWFVSNSQGKFGVVQKVQDILNRKKSIFIGGGEICSKL